MPKTVPVREHIRWTRRGALPVRFHLHRYRDRPEIEEILQKNRASAFIDPNIDPYTVNLVQEIEPIENTINHEVLHSTLHHLGESKASHDLDRIVARDVGIGSTGFTDRRISAGPLTQALRDVGLADRAPPGPSRFERP